MTEQQFELTSETSAASFAPDHSAPALAPLIKIRPHRKSLFLEAKEIWEYREMLFLFVWRDMKVRYKQTALGIAWAVLQPLSLALVFVIFFGIVVRVPSNGIPYPLFAYSGLLAWLFFAQAVGTGCQTLSGHGSLINQIYFPPLILPLANIFVRLIDFVAAATVMGGLMFYYGIAPGWKILLGPFLVIELAVLAFGLSAALAALHLKYRDVGSLLPVILQIWMFCSPIVYPASLISGRWRRVYILNPLVGILENFRAVLFGLPLDTLALRISIVTTLAVTAVSLWIFYMISKDVADVY
jgi:lipopolysaccharide transport system permease protein